MDLQSGKKYRITRQRRVILDDLRKMHSHPTTDEIYIVVRRILPHISLGTVYRTLEFLTEKGFIKKLEFSGNQKRFDGNIKKHHHICCVCCNRVDDVPTKVFKEVECVTEYIQGYKVIDFHFYFTGICEECSSKK